MITLMLAILGAWFVSLFLGPAIYVAVSFAGVLVFYGTRIAVRNVDVDTVALFFTIGAVYAIVPLAGIAVGLYALADARAAVGQLVERARP
jgi:TRAP-type C4-dicarboxylate transport system permease small subunit